jgi:hypothetical protein
MSDFDIDMRPILRLSDLIREKGDYVGFVDERTKPGLSLNRSAPKVLCRCGWVLDVNGLLIGYETIDYSVPLPDGEDGVRSRINGIDERVHELTGRGWSLRYLFLGQNWQGDAIFLGRRGMAMSPALVGDRDRFLTDMSLVRFSLRLDLQGRSAERVKDENFREMPVRLSVRHQPVAA